MSAEQLGGYYKRLAKQGVAEFNIVFKAAPNDEEFSANDPVAEVTIEAKDPTNGKIYRSEPAQMSAKVSELAIPITILDIGGILKRAWNRVSGKEPPKPYEVTVTVTPHPEWKSYYEVGSFPVLGAKLGRNSARHVWMVAKPGRGLYRKLDKS